MCIRDRDKRTSNSGCASNCCGCSACASKCPKNAISMRYDHEGFLYPFVDSEIFLAYDAKIVLTLFGSLLTPSINDASFSHMLST